MTSICLTNDALEYLSNLAKVQNLIDSAVKCSQGYHYKQAHPEWNRHEYENLIKQTTRTIPTY